MGIQTSAQDTRIKEQFNRYSQQALQEKLYLHTDKNFYLAGEICWFKIYNTDAVFNRPLGISKVAYVELLDKNNKPVLQSKVSLKNGGGNGSLQLPASLGSGNYLLRAYTNWMKNFDAAYFFEKKFTVVNTRRIYTDTIARQKAKYDIQFFPEGGNLVNGVESRVAFRVVDQNGKGVSCKGRVINDKNDTIGTFSTFKFGMGSFLLTPEQLHTYKAVILLPGDSLAITALPAAYPNGYVMQLSRPGSDQLKITVQSADKSLSTPIYLFAHTRGLVKLSAVAEMHNGMAVFLTGTDKLGEGISQFTIFNAQQQPVCERLYFKKPLKNLQLETTTDQQVYEPRKKIDIRISSAGQDNVTAMPAEVSMAVYRVDSLTMPDEMDISNYCWLSSDLAGAVESPGYYFSAEKKEAGEAADNLMLTQGWRRFRWEDVLQQKEPAFRFLPEYKGHIVKGRVVNNNGDAVREVEAFLSVPGTKTQFRDAVSDDSGFVKFEMSNFYGNDEIVLQTTGQEDGLRHVDIANPFTEKYSPTVLPSFLLPAKNTDATLSAQHLSVQVQNTYFANMLKQAVIPPVDSTPFYYKPDQSYILDDYVRFTTVEEILREYVPDVNVRKQGGKFVLPVYDNIRKEFFKTNPLLLLDGVPIMDADKMMQYDPLKIKKLEVVARMYYYGNMFFGGVVNFITYHGDMPGYELDPHATVLDYGTMQLQREFFSPVYEATQAQRDHLPDFRNLLYWSPDISTGRDGKSRANFYTSDIPGRFAIVTEGLAADGRTGSKTVFFEVKEKMAWQEINSIAHSPGIIFAASKTGKETL